MTMLKKLGSALLATLAFAGLASAQKWQALKHEPSFPVGAIALLSDGTVLLHEEQDSTPQKAPAAQPSSPGQSEAPSNSPMNRAQSPENYATRLASGLWLAPVRSMP